MWWWNCLEGLGPVTSGIKLMQLSTVRITCQQSNMVMVVWWCEDALQLQGLDDLPKLSQGWTHLPQIAVVAAQGGRTSIKLTGQFFFFTWVVYMLQSFSFSINHEITWQLFIVLIVVCLLWHEDNTPHWKSALFVRCLISLLKI